MSCKLGRRRGGACSAPRHPSSASADGADDLWSRARDSVCGDSRQVRMQLSDNFTHRVLPPLASQPLHPTSACRTHAPRLSSRAPLRLKAMLDSHKDAHVAQCYDGVAMFKELIALKNTTGLVEESIDHDIAVEEMRDTQLPDGCAVSEFTAKVNSKVIWELNWEKQECG